MSTILVLAMHGAPPNDFPTKELMEFMSLHNQLERTVEHTQAAIQKRYAELEMKVRSWPRTSTNDPFYAGSLELADHLRGASGLPVLLGFNEFCAPSLDEALEQAASTHENVLVITPMMTRGGEHSEVDIPTSIRKAQNQHPKVAIQYVWPFEVSEVAKFLSEQVSRYK